MHVRSPYDIDWDIYHEEVKNFFSYEYYILKALHHLSSILLKTSKHLTK